MSRHGRYAGKEGEPLLKADECEKVEVEEYEQKGFPKCIFFILGNEFCERYSYYGMRTILVLYLKYYLKWDDDTATAVYHAFTVLAYLFPLLGAVVADSWWGKYNTILWLSIVYSIGMVLNTMGAIGPIGDLTVHAVLSSIGLLVIAIGTGGIKPCVSAFGGDQFEAEQENYRRRFFSLFYFAINAGSLVSTFVSPLIRDEVKCFGDDCYALAFGIPAILMVVAIFLFLIGTPWYKRVMPSDKIFFMASKCVWAAWKNRWNTPRKQRNKEHWMDYADDGTNSTLVRDLKYVFRVLFLYIPLPVFWALFDQQGSRWTLQAVRMDGYVGSLRILPDQMQICNPLFIVCMIPLFEATLYPCLRHFNINFSPLRRMTLGMILAGLSFVVAALIQMKIDVNLTKFPEGNGQTSLRVINAGNCDLTVQSDIYPEWMGDMEGSGGVVIGPGSASDTKEELIKPGTFMINYDCPGKPGLMTSKEITLVGKEAMDFVVSEESATMFKDLLSHHPTEKSDSGKASVGIINTLNEPVTVEFRGEDKGIKTLPVAINQRQELEQLNKGSYEMTVTTNGTIKHSKVFKYTVATGGLYTVVIRQLTYDAIASASDFTMDFYTDIYENDVNIFWMIPQYFIITLGEVFLSVTGLEFSYSQSPPSMKSILQSFWLLTVSIGNIIVLIIAEARLIPNQADEYFLFAGLIGIAAIAFIILSIRYEYVDESEFAEDDEDQQKLAEHTFSEKPENGANGTGAVSNGKENAGFEHESGF
uniref:Solute carrier family 15 member 2-like n=1 Tax=Phallusia mammillata TaxID=59560 RepID=A0A6F9DSG2_9ASCI|nr:solute carrier family 15 member 2-like [Phallusia mammillata]